MTNRLLLSGYLTVYLFVEWTKNEEKKKTTGTQLTEYGYPCEHVLVRYGMVCIREGYIELG